MTEVKKKGLRCKKEVKDGKHRYDAECRKKDATVSVEVKNNLKDAQSSRSKNQLKGMVKTANKNNKAMILHLAQENCSVGLNKKGKQFVKDNKLRICRNPSIRF